MSTAFLILFAVFAAFTSWAIWRLFESWRVSAGKDLLTGLEGELQELQELAAVKARLLRDIKDLEFDHQTGHVSVEDYRDMRRKMEAKAIHVLKRLDELRGNVDYDSIIDDEYERRFGDGDEDAPEPRRRARRADESGGRRRAEAMASEPRRRRKKRPVRDDEPVDAPPRRRKKKKRGEDSGPRVKRSAEADPDAPTRRRKRKSPPSDPAPSPRPRGEVARQAAREAQGELLCSNCETQLEADSLFCHVCGTPVESQTQDSPAAAEVAAAGR